jgi:hypothetical protein
MMSEFHWFLLTKARNRTLQSRVADAERQMERFSFMVIHREVKFYDKAIR